MRCGALRMLIWTVRAAAKEYEEAIEQYTKAVECYPTAVFFSNRAMAHMKLENWGSVIADATSAIELDEANAKVPNRPGEKPACAIFVFPWEA